MNPVGIFDSGIGGLNVVQAIFTQLPGLPVIYYGDTAHLPYGNKSSDTIRGYVRNITDFLLSHNVSAIVIACNTASAVATELVKQMAKDIPVFEVITPTCKVAIQTSQNKKIGIIGTEVTIQSGIYRETLLHLNASFEVVQKATPLLVPLIEDGWLGHPLVDMVIEAYLSDHIFQKIDTLILGCTHYSLLKFQIQTFFRKHGFNIHVIESSTAVARLVKNFYQNQLGHILDTDFSATTYQFFVSDLNPYFKNLVRRLLPSFEIYLKEVRL